ncbi:hypothetical protein [Streptomyces antimicrobicus]|uniref:Lipoprotein n=1 Tax=Streptomyces antimicrobicus TaxID=2883108 RepID=A0ABS8B8Z8_9ACTN|nr:hypothetical protein [Streptomyces antimicrobicus]MCB5181043.1 hypothetical protein [Streptomyces antimicrobicus]
MAFEDELGAALRRAGGAFSPDQRALAAAGEQYGRRLVVRRRVGAVAGALAIAAVAGAGSYAGGLFGGGGQGPAGPARLAAGAVAPSGGGTGGAGPARVGSGAVPAEQMIAVLRQLLPGGSLAETQARGTEDELGPMASGVYDDGRGRAAVSVALQRVAPGTDSAQGLTRCPDKKTAGYDDCSEESLGDGSRLQILRGYEYADRRAPTKLWRAVLVTREGHVVEASEWNAPAEKGAAVSRAEPPLDRRQLRALVTSSQWLPALNDLPAAVDGADGAAEANGAGGADGARRSPSQDPEALALLTGRLAGYGLRIASRGGEGGIVHAVVDDGQGLSLVQVEVQPGFRDPTNAEGSIFRSGGSGGATVTTLPDGTKLRTEQRPGDKGAGGQVWWRVDSLRPDGLRVIVSAFNGAAQEQAPTRAVPALGMEQLKELALQPKWRG